MFQRSLRLAFLHPPALAKAEAAPDPDPGPSLGSRASLGGPPCLPPPPAATHNAAIVLVRHVTRGIKSQG